MVKLQSITQPEVAQESNTTARSITKLKSGIGEIEQNLFSQSRQKNGFINFGGTVLKFLFGTMYSDDMERIEILGKISSFEEGGVTL
jgi:hypothetical protein